jgi:ubiquinone/menaquinone biosynthesis C-methylase UbiE
MSSAFLEAIAALLQRGCNRSEDGYRRRSGPTGRTPQEASMALDMDVINEFIGKFAGDLGATVAAGGVVTGHRLGLFKALAEGPATPDELAARTGTDARYVTEWLRGQAAGGYINRAKDADVYSMSEEQAFLLTDPDGPAYLPGAFILALGALKAEPQIAEAFRTGEGFGWHEHNEDVFEGCEKFFRPGYVANLVPSWIPALEGVEEKLRAGAKVADVGCGLGASSVLLASEYERTQVVGSDYHEGSIELARKRAADAGVSERVNFEVASAQTFTGTGYDLVATFDCLHDMGDPLSAARHIRESLDRDGTWLIVEPFANDDVADNMNPVGRVYYNFSIYLCVPSALSQRGGYALGAQAGEAAIRQVVTDAGFTRFRRAAETPFNLVYEARP